MTLLRIPSTVIDPAPAGAGEQDRPPSSATRHLSVGAYLDEEFRRLALRDVYGERHRSVAPSVGFDLVTVLEHCKRARRGVVVRDAAVLALITISFMQAAKVTVDVLAVLCAAQLVVFVIRFVMRALSTDADEADDEAEDGDTEPIDADAASTKGDRHTRAYRAISAAGEQFAHRHRKNIFVLVTLTLVPLIWIALGDFGGSLTGPELAGYFLVVLSGGCIAIPLTWGQWRQHRIEQLTRQRARSAGHAPGRTMRTFADAASSNTTVHSAYRPFIGTGPTFIQWSFAGRLLRPPIAGDPRPARDSEREFKTSPFSTMDLIRRLRKRLGALSGDEVPEQQVAGLTVSDHVLVPSSEIGGPRIHTSTEQLDALISRPTQPERHYLVTQVVTWEGELVVSVHLHVAVQGATLYLELVNTALLPCKEEYRIIDRQGGTGPIAHIVAAATSLLNTPRIILLAPASLVRELRDAAAMAVNRSGLRRYWLRGYDYGARVSVRESGSRHMSNAYSQMQDIRKYQQIIERRIIASILDFLVERGVDTAEFRERASVVLNAGIIATGGSVTVTGNITGQSTTINEAQ